MSVHLLESSADKESQPLLSPDSYPEWKQEKWLAFTSFTSQSHCKPLSQMARLLAGAIIFLIFIAVSFFAIFCYPSSTTNEAYTGMRITSPEIQNFWGAYTPYSPVTPYIPPPSQCQITQVRSNFLSIIIFLLSIDFVQTG
jgi:hypothetical protein